MSPGPIRRLTGLVGLVALIPTAVMLVTHAITPADAAARGVITVVVVLAVGRLVYWWVRSMAGALERGERAGAALAPGGGPGRRATDRRPPAAGV